MHRTHPDRSGCADHRTDRDGVAADFDVDGYTHGYTAAANCHDDLNGNGDANADPHGDFDTHTRSDCDESAD